MSDEVQDTSELSHEQPLEAVETEQVETVGDESEEQTPEQQEQHKKGGFQRRIDKLTREKTEAARELEYWKQEALKGKQQEPEQRQPEPAQSNAKPRMEDFTDAADYIEAVTEWKAEQLLNERENRTKQETTQREIATTWKQKVEATRSELPDFDDVIASADVPVPKVLRDALLESDMGPKLAYHLAKHPEEAEAIAAMSESQVLRAIGRLEARLEGNTTASPAPAKKVSNAPAPIKPLGGGSSNSKTVANMTNDEYRAYRAKQGATWAR